MSNLKKKYVLFRMKRFKRLQSMKNNEKIVWHLYFKIKMQKQESFWLEIWGKSEKYMNKKNVIKFLIALRLLTVLFDIW